MNPLQNPSTSHAHSPKKTDLDARPALQMDLDQIAAPLDTKLDLASKLFQRSIFPAASRVAEGGRLGSPLVVDLDPTTFCDLACPECISTQVLNKGQFGPKRLIRLAEELCESGVKAVILIGGGEPLIHQSTDRVIKTLYDSGVRVGMVTNGTLIDRHLDTLSHMMSWVRVSVDAATQPTYDLFRPSGRPKSVFPKLVANMRLLASVKRGRLGFSFLLMQRYDASGKLIASNYDEVLEAGHLAKDIGCDYFEVKAMFDETHHIVSQSAASIDRVNGQLNSLRDLETPLFKVLASSTWHGLSSDESKVQTKLYSTCKIAELRTTITPSGVYTCAYHRGNDKARIGDVGVTSFKEMWDNADVSRIDPRIDCTFHCARHKSNLAMEDKELMKNVRVLSDDYDPFI